MLVAARIAFVRDEITYVTIDRGLLFPSPNLWISDHWLTMVVNTGLLLATALVWMFVIQVFNPFRALTNLPGTFFLIMVLSVPDIADQLTTGTILAALMPACMALLWSAFADEGRLRHIFLLFAILSGMTMTQYAFAVYIPAFIIGCAQMKIMSVRTIVACLLGLVTPWWIVIGTGIADFNELHLPDTTAFFAAFDTDGIVNLLLVSIGTGIITLVTWFVNIMKVITLNVNMRSYNGNIAMVGLFTIVAMCADFTNTSAYLPTLMLVASYQLSLLFGTSNDNRNTIVPLVIMAIYVAVYVVRIFV